MENLQNTYTFHPRDEKQILLFEKFRQLRKIFGSPNSLMYLRALARTRPHVRTVYPPGWKNLVS